MSDGIDISNYQGNIGDLGSDIDFVIIKVTEGSSYVNPFWTEQRDKARADGKVVLYYHFQDDVNNTNEVQHFLNTVGSSRLQNEGAAWDWETGGYTDAVDACGAIFFDAVKQAWGVNTFPYSNAARINSGQWPRLTARHAPLWEAAYASSPPSPSPFPVIAIWQFTSSAREQGVSGAVDKDRFNGTRDQLIQLIEGGDMATASQIDNLISLLDQVGWGRAPSDAVFNDERPYLSNDVVGGTIAILQNADKDPESAKNRIPALEAKVADLEKQLAAAAQPTPTPTPTHVPTTPTAPNPVVSTKANPNLWQRVLDALRRIGL